MAFLQKFWLFWGHCYKRMLKEESDASLTTKAIFSAAVWKKRQILVTKIVKFWRRLDQHVGRGRSSVSRHPIWRICAVFKPYNSPNSAFQKWLKYEVQKQN